jgi:hypothetical protein
MRGFERDLTKASRVFGSPVSDPAVVLGETISFTSIASICYLHTDPPNSRVWGWVVLWPGGFCQLHFCYLCTLHTQTRRDLRWEFPGMWGLCNPALSIGSIDRGPGIFPSANFYSIRMLPTFGVWIVIADAQVPDVEIVFCLTWI